ncbi:hypothetical protein B0H13DRAFT_1593762 [Mycena leptocephala]|nr:hypothetical protein B0H13DRAFT_1593762 [Mycena leptocephala]
MNSHCQLVAQSSLPPYGRARPQASCTTRTVQSRQLTTLGRYPTGNRPTSAHPLLTPSGRTFAAGGKVRNVSSDPLSPCIMFWPENEPLPEQGQIRPIGHTLDVRFVLFLLAFFFIAEYL